MEAACIFGSDLENVLLPSGAPPKAEAWGRRSLCTKVPKTSGRVGFIPGLGFLTASLPELANGANEQQNFRGTLCRPMSVRQYGASDRHLPQQLVKPQVQAV